MRRASITDSLIWLVSFTISLDVTVRLFSMIIRARYPVVCSYSYCQRRNPRGAEHCWFCGRELSL